MELKNKKIMIVVEETGEHDGKGFQVYMAGDVERIGQVPKNELSPAELWGGELMSVCIQVLKQAGVIESKHMRN